MMRPGDGVDCADDAGFSLIETLVVIFLVGVVGSVVTAGIVTAQKTTRQDQARSQSANQLRSTVDRLSRDLRVSDPIRSASATDITVDTYPGSRCVRVRWLFSGTMLQVQRQTFNTPASCSVYPAVATPSVDTGLITALTNLTSGSANGFVYYNDTGSTGPSTSVSPTAGTLTTLTRIVFTLSQDQAEGRAAVLLSTGVELRNHS